MNDILTGIILHGLKKHGRKKTFDEILQEAHVPYTDILRYSLATFLEEEGLIHNVSYQLPLRIRAELTEKGMNVTDEMTTS